MKKISYFDTSEKLLQNLLNCTERDIDMHFVKASLKTLITLVKTQNDILKNILEDDSNITESANFINNDDTIKKGMICWIREKRKFGQIISIDEENDKCSLRVLDDSNTIVTASRSQFNSSQNLF